MPVSEVAIRVVNGSDTFRTQHVLGALIASMALAQNVVSLLRKTSATVTSFRHGPSSGRATVLMRSMCVVSSTAQSKDDTA